MLNLPYDKQKFTNRLRELREEKNLTQEQLSNIFNVARSNIGKYENGEVDLSTELLMKYSDFFECSIEYILGITNDKTKTFNAENYIDKEYISLFRDSKAKKLTPEKIRKIIDFIQDMNS